MMYTMEEYGSGHWAVYAPNGTLLCVCLYKKGAVCVTAHLNELINKRKEVANG